VVEANGEKRERKKSLVLKLKGAQLATLVPFMMEEDFSSLAKEYQLRLNRLEELGIKRSGLKVKSPDWGRVQKTYLQELGSLSLWLGFTGYSDAVLRMDRKLSHEKRRGSNPGGQRLLDAVETVHLVPVDPELAAAAVDIGGSGLKFRSVESRHMKIICHAGISDKQMIALAELGERVIEDFRAEFVDPYLGDGFRDEIPEEIFVQFFFSDDQARNYEHLYEQYLGGDWGSGKDREQLLSLNGKWIYFENTLMSYWRTGPFADLEGRVVHGIGHRLAALNYQIHPGSQDWLEEAVGYHLSLRFLNKNTTICFDLRPSTISVGETTAHANAVDAGDRGFGGLFIGKRATMAADAVVCQEPFFRLIRLRKYDFDREEFSKAWALFTFLAEAKGRKGQDWLRGLTEIVDASDFHSLLQEHTRDTFGYEHSIPLNELEQEWKAYMRKTYDE